MLGSNILLFIAKKLKGKNNSHYTMLFKVYQNINPTKVNYFLDALSYITPGT
jgi:hypothetical protein